MYNIFNIIINISPKNQSVIDPAVVVQRLRYFSKVKKNPIAAYIYGNIQLDIEKCYYKCIKYVKLSVDEGFLPAINLYGFLHDNGIGVKENAVVANKCYSTAIK